MHSYLQEIYPTNKRQIHRVWLTDVTDLFTFRHIHNGATVCLLALPCLSVFLSLGLLTCLQVSTREMVNDFHKIFYYGVLLKFVIPILVQTVQEQHTRYENLRVILHMS
jgi:hypothetical protein